MAEIRIEELQPKYTLDDKTVILVEDDDDTKKSTIGSLMSSITYNESINPNKQANKFYNATQIQRLLKMYSEGTNDPETIAQLYQQIQELDANVDELKDAINGVLDTMTEDDFNKMMDEAISVQPLSSEE